MITEEKVTFLIRLPKPMLQKIRQEAKNAEMSMNNLVLECIHRRLFRPTWEIPIDTSYLDTASSKAEVKA